MQPSQAVDLTNCDREPIHIPGAIQPHGCLLACDSSLSIIRRASVNAAAILGLDGRNLVGERVDTLFGERLTHDMRNAATAATSSRAGLLFDIAIAPGAAPMDVMVHAHKGAVIVEFELAGSRRGAGPLEIARTLITRLGRIQQSDALIASTSRLIRALLHYDRVMIYRFAENGSGEVISESKRSDLESFLGQHFRAGDIPKQARQLYIDNTIRVIGDASATPVAVAPVLLSGEPLDLSFAHLRAVSPIHCEYLRNMGVAASMSVSIIIDGALWGLIACHHYSPRTLTMAERVAAEMFGQFFAMSLESLSHKRRHEVAMRARRLLDNMLQHMAHHLDVATLLRENLENLKQLVPCDGIGLWIHGSWDSSGLTPPRDAIPAIARFVNSVSAGRSWATDTLSDCVPAAHDFTQEASGLLAVPLSQIPRDYLMLFRKEVAQTVNWAGDPNKTYETGPQGDRLTPRKSFAIWKQEVERRSIAWSESDREIAEAARAALVEIVMRYNELLADERSKADVRQKMLNEELNHRVKNILALIKSLVSYPVEKGKALTDYVASLRGRIQALAFAHDQVVRGSGGGALSDLLRAELSPYRDVADAVTLNGPHIQLDARAFSVLALVLHELATNAAKYGALSNKRGKLSVTWRLIADDDCEIVWRESGGPKVDPPSRQGFGSVLLSRSVPFDLGGVSDVSYPASGVEARLVIPGKYIAAGSDPVTAVAPGAAAQARSSNILTGRRVLLVEDQLIIALDAESIFGELGASVVETASSVEEAHALLRHFTPDIAVLDINLGVDTSWPIAEELKRRDIPFVLASGYGDLSGIPGDWVNTLQIVRKPYDRDLLAGALEKGLAAHALR